MNWREVITADPDVVHGQVRFAGTRIQVSVVLDCLAGGRTEAEILREYPTLPAGAVRTALGYAEELAGDDFVPSPPPSEGEDRREPARVGGDGGQSRRPTMCGPVGTA